MGVSSKLDDNIFEIFFEGRFTTTELLDVIRSGLSTHEGPRPLFVLINTSQSEELKTPDEIRSIADAFAEKRGVIGPRLAVYVIQQVRFGLARILGAHLENHGISCSPFYNRDEAIQWLRANPSTAD